MRSKKRNKTELKKEKVPQLIKWHVTLREKYIRTDADEPSYDDKWGQYKCTERLDFDQSPLQKDLQICSSWPRLYT